MRLLVINPNTSESVTALIRRAAEAAAAPGTEIVTDTAPWGVPYIATRTEAALGGHVALEMLARHQPGYDAAIIAAFGDPGLGAARELFPQPVIGLAEAGMLTACMLGQKFAIVTFSNALTAWYRECVAWHGLEGRLAGIFTLTESFRDIGDVQVEKEEKLVALCHSALAASDADVIVLAGAPLAGLAHRVADRVPVPVIDCVAAAVCQAETLARLNPRKATAGSFARPGAKAATGADEALARWIEGREGAVLPG
ncbi:Asp/Glu/hydantoin racemase [Halovulum dunhuangense]|uniref:Asp/Glu/hydantoin racemase n=1 Tax=Halovulum dunhuangense TaxID=1505036 RepID=A0A849L701_9RHOB|nr:aspartate/glutamate racemase family protein [Halovulum dunhuangense]NNU82219.1 Asp/Glu/hydantoin racemase [Halovulum dunhuangense]